MKQNHQNSTNDKNWFKLCRICLEWIHPIQHRTPEEWEQWLMQVVERAESLSINTLAFDLYHGGYALFAGAVAEKDRHLGDVDLFALLDREVHKRGLKFVLMHMATHCNNFVAYNYPQWLQRDVHGNPKPSHPAPLPCLNSPWTNFFMQELQVVLSRYQIDGVYIEGIIAYPCYCDFCQTEFLKQYGYALPTDSGMLKSCTDYHQFSRNITNDYIRKVRGVINEVSPHTIWIPCNHVHDSEENYTDFPTWGKYADAVELERFWGKGGYQIPLREIGLSMQLISAASGKPPFGTLSLAWGVDVDYSHRTPQHYRLNFAEILLFGGTPQLHAQTIFDLDQSEMAVVKEMYDFEMKVRPTLLEAEQVKYAAIVFDRADLPGDWCKGCYRALIEAHIPFTMLPKSALNRETLSQHKVVILPNLTMLSDEQIAALQEYVTGGGGLVFTYRTSMDSHKQNNPLLQLAGCRGPFGVNTNPPTFIRSEYAVEQSCLLNFYKAMDGNIIEAGNAGRLQSFVGSYVQVELAGGQLVAQGIGYDYNKSFHRHHPFLGWYPGAENHPLIIANKAGGKVVYFAAEMDASAQREGMPGVMQLITEAVLWAGGTPPIQVQCSPTVEMAVHYSPAQKAYTILFVNHTTNQLSTEWIVRHVEPVHDIKIRMDIGEAQVKAVDALVSGKVNWQQNGDNLELQLPAICEYEGVVVQLG